MDVFNSTIDYVLEKHSDLLTFPCPEHKSAILTTIFQNYILMRMKQFTLTHNRELKQNSSKKKNYQSFKKHKIIYLLVIKMYKLVITV